jgi:sugar transferase (PEP-CTERM/EpsH1 system associated)
MITPKDKIRLLFVTPCFGYGGLERVLLDLITNIDRTRFSPSFCSLISPVGEMFRLLENLYVPCTILEKGDGINVSLIFKLARLIKRDQIDLINAHDIGATLYAAPAARLAGVDRIVHTDHSQVLTLNRFIPVYRWILQHLVTRSITVSDNLRDFLQREMRVDEDVIETIPNGLNVSRFKSDGGGRRLINELGLSEDSIVIGTIGRLTEQKGRRYLIDAFALLHEKYANAVCIIVGDGDLRDELRDRAAEKGLENQIFFTGNRDDIPDLLDLFDVFVLPSLWEGQPITIMEAMAAGKPIIATAVGGNTEILRSGKFGLLVPEKNPDELARAMDQLLDDNSLAAELGDRARKHAEQELDSGQMTQRYEEVFLSCF